MIMLRKTHNHEISLMRKDMESLKKDYIKVTDELYEVNMVVNNLEYLKSKMNIKLTISDEKKIKYKKELEELKDKNMKLLKDVELLGKVYNNMNRKLWANHEAQRQLRRLSEDMIDADKINKNEVANYINQLANLIGGGEEYEFMGLEEAIAKAIQEEAAKEE